MLPQLTKCTAVLVVDEVEPCVDFWVNRFGFQKTGEVPEGDRIGFAMLAKDSVELMYQSRTSVAKDMGKPLEEVRKSETALYIHVNDIDATIARLDGAPVMMPRRDTFYGATEIWVFEPGGNQVGFAMFGAAPAKAD